MNELPVIYKHGIANHIEIITYPDGQHNIKLDMNYFNDPKMIINIICSIRNIVELEILACIVAALKKHDFYIHCIEFVYLFGLRSDRAFSNGMPNYARDVLAPFIESLHIKNIRILYPHSLYSVSNLNYTVCIDNGRMSTWLFPLVNELLIGADESACFRGDNVSGFFHKKRNGDEITLSLSPITKTALKQSSDKTIFIVDDLCDRGATFIAAAKYMREFYPERELKLFIVHALFTKGIDIVAEHYDQIICTNSYQEIEHPKVRQIKVF